MNMKTMTSNPHRRFFSPLGVGPSSNKRRERDDGFHVLKPSNKKIAKPTIPRPGSAPTPKSPPPHPASNNQPTPKPASNNQLLAGYLANEFLTKGTLFGETWDPARAEAVPLSNASRLKSSDSNSKAKAEPSTRAVPKKEEKGNQRYVEVADLLRTDGAHIPGIVNPTQLARFLQL